MVQVTPSIFGKFRKRSPVTQLVKQGTTERLNDSKMNGP
jgi:hypothetical protein